MISVEDLTPWKWEGSNVVKKGQEPTETNEDGGT
jgi:hypothetical protein